MDGRFPYMSVYISAEILPPLPEAMDSALRHGRLRHSLVALPQHRNKCCRRGRALCAASTAQRKRSACSDSKESDSACLLKGITSVIWCYDAQPCLFWGISLPSPTGPIDIGRCLNAFKELQRAVSHRVVCCRPRQLCLVMFGVVIEQRNQEVCSLWPENDSLWWHGIPFPWSSRIWLARRTDRGSRRRPTTWFHLRGSCQTFLLAATNQRAPQHTTTATSHL